MSAQSDSNIVPFGKYRGQSINQLLADQNYCCWLLAQPGFRERFPAIVNIIVNRGAEPEETPEHNAMQVLFLDDVFCFALARLLFPDRAKRLLAAERSFLCNLKWQRYLDKDERKLKEEAERLISLIESGGKIIAEHWQVPRRRFEQEGWDCIFEVRAIVELESMPQFEWFRREFAIECKPHIGDDYAAVLRQIKRYRFCETQVLLVGYFEAQGASFKQVKQIFVEDGIHVVRLAEIEDLR